MARQEIILGTPPQGIGGDPPRTASMKINAMTLELFAALGAEGGSLPAVLPAAKGGTGNTNGTAAKLAAAAIVGAVSQASGIPTGAIIERGSNTNGTYVKLADGTMICRRTLGPLSISANSIFNDAIKSFAAQFNASPAVIPVCNCDYPFDISVGPEGGISGSSFRLSLKNRNASVTVSNIYVDVVAFGSWF